MPLWAKIAAKINIPIYEYMCIYTYVWTLTYKLDNLDILMYISIFADLHNYTIKVLNPENEQPKCAVPATPHDGKIHKKLETKFNERYFIFEEGMSRWRRQISTLIRNIQSGGSKNGGIITPLFLDACIGWRHHHTQKFLYLDRLLDTSA